MPLKRNYCTNILGNIFSVNGSLTVNMEDFDTPDIPVPLDDEHESVDMGNGLKWATCNVGAENPWDYGDFFAWGETATKANYCLDTYLWSNQTSFTKYTTFGTTLESADDAATANWGGAWRTPTVAEWAWLLENSNSEWTDNYEGKGVSGRIVTSTVNGNQIFLPIAGYWDSDIHTGKKFGLYWSSTLDDFSLTDAEYVLVSGGNINIDHACRFFGQSVRPVTD